MSDKIEQLDKLNNLKEKGVISEKEFEKSKQDLLNSLSIENANSNVSNKSKITALILCIFLGFLGTHRFYTGSIFLGIIYFFTFGLFGIGVLIDFILILCDSYKDSNGKILTK